MLAPHSSLIVADSTQVGAARRAVARLCTSAGADEMASGRAAIVVAELATNLVRYARDGQLVFGTVLRSNGLFLEILSIDKGPGIPNVALSLRDGHSTGGTPGNGLGAIQRLSEEFDIFSLPEKGTIVYSCILLKKPSDTASGHGVWEWAGISCPAPNEEVCGDAWSIVERDRALRFMVADGLGHGPDAHKAAAAAVEVFLAAQAQSATGVLQIAHARLHGTRGAAVASGKIEADRLTFSGVGNISATLVNHVGQKGLMSHNGIVGTRQIRTTELASDWSANDLLVLHSDGLSARWTLSNWPGLINRHPAVVAAVLFRDHVRGRDDVTVVVLRKRLRRNGQ